MNKPVQPDLERAFASASALPREQQDALAAEILSRVSELSGLRLTDAQRLELTARLTGAPRYADPAAVQDFFKRHDAGT
jgi:hypothetical protein